VKVKHSEERLAKEMDMIFLHIERTYRPGVGFTETTNFLFDECSQLAHQNLFPLLGTPDKVVSQLIRDMLGLLRIHACHYNRCSNSCEVPREGRLPPR
jgi:hypothetical protein